MDKSAITMTTGCDWWLERVTMDGEQRYPERIRVGSLERPRVYVPERTCRMVTIVNGRVWKCSGYGQVNLVKARGGYRPHCGARVVDES